ncbi:hypothetical protein [Frankia sp. AgB32]|uniref:hypothetical protein n=1 Tax=Frankia sp. AgB32 TaxID=631119 RepID=UPI0020103ECC|nr:hypothetical protein [Frankia sp. AgB32]MCK9895242.1 hypothetical protein [Frankia sp. AgB32]
MPSPQPHRVAVLVIGDVPGTDPGDAANRLAVAIINTLPEQMPTPDPRGRRLPDSHLHSVAPLATAARNGHITVQLAHLPD